MGGLKGALLLALLLALGCTAQDAHVVRSKRPSSGPKRRHCAVSTQAGRAPLLPARCLQEGLLSIIHVPGGGLSDGWRSVGYGESVAALLPRSRPPARTAAERCSQIALHRTSVQ